jgi:hypothetical protein
VSVNTVQGDVYSMQQYAMKYVSDLRPVGGFLLFSVLFLHIVGPCNPDPCQNGGTCTVNGADFFCLCDLGFIGTRCQGKSVIKL